MNSHMCSGIDQRRLTMYVVGMYVVGCPDLKGWGQKSSLCRFMFLIPSDPEKKKKETICREDETAV